ncbi:hypothetical protein I7I48_09849 [Histoplasma ohiense]|nr:hypothetical protein I7I48_09849 [Histoplasma ohiense (nom. inval.)]
MPSMLSGSNTLAASWTISAQTGASRQVDSGRARRLRRRPLPSKRQRTIRCIGQRRTLHCSRRCCSQWHRRTKGGGGGSRCIHITCSCWVDLRINWAACWNQSLGDPWCSRSEHCRQGSSSLRLLSCGSIGRCGLKCLGCERKGTGRSGFLLEDGSSIYIQCPATAAANAHLRGK